MVLLIDSNATYLIMPQAKSKIASHYHLSNHLEKIPHSTINSSILVECRELKHVVSSSTKGETTRVFHNTQITISICYILKKLNYSQLPTPIKTDNSIAIDFVHKNISQKSSKLWNMCYYWLREQDTKKQFNIYLNKEYNNHANY